MSNPGAEVAAGAVVQADRTRLFRYLTGEMSSEYRQIMGLFTTQLLGDLSAADVAARLNAGGLHLSVEEVGTRCERLEVWGNLVRGVSDARVATVKDYLRSRTRYQASKLGGRVHRDAEAVLAAGDGAKEVARELLGATVETLERILAMVAGPTPPGAGTAALDAEQLAGQVTTVFNNHRLFNESILEFYNSINAVLTRYDLAGAEYQQFKTRLMEYIDLITSDVSRHAPAITWRFHQLEPHLDTLLSALGTLPAPTLPDGSAGERLPGRTQAEWDALAGWYAGRDGRSGPEDLRAAAGRALGQLLANTKRMLASAGVGVSRRADLLKLAAWFDNADSADAHRLYAATFGAHPARHLLVGPDEPDPRDGAGTSWWDAAAVDVPISLRERGDRTPRGRTARVPDPALAREALLAATRAAAQARGAAAGELVAAGTLDGAHVSPAARDLLMERLGDLLARYQELAGPVATTDTDLGLTLRAAPDPRATTVVRADDGSVTIYGLTLSAASSAAQNSASSDDSAGDTTAAAAGGGRA